MDAEQTQTSSPALSPWWRREIRPNPRVFGISRPTRIFLAVTLPLLFLYAFTWKPLWLLGWRVPVYACSDFVPVRTASGAWMPGGTWVRSKEIRVYGGPGVQRSAVVNAVLGIQGLVEELGLDITVREAPLPADAARDLRAATRKNAVRSWLDFNRFTALRLDARRDQYAEVFLVASALDGEGYAAGMAYFRAGIVAMREARALGDLLPRHEGAHLLGYDKHDDLPFFILGYRECLAPDARDTLMMHRGGSTSALSPRARDALREFWRGLEERHNAAYFRTNQ